MNRFYGVPVITTIGALLHLKGSLYHLGQSDKSIPKTGKLLLILNHICVLKSSDSSTQNHRSALSSLLVPNSRSQSLQSASFAPKARSSPFHPPEFSHPTVPAKTLPKNPQAPAQIISPEPMYIRMWYIHTYSFNIPSKKLNTSNSRWILVTFSPNLNSRANPIVSQVNGHPNVPYLCTAVYFQRPNGSDGAR
ncbi:hypothetical protein P154DRAFT_356406 [Amniculicola lignicola CBS 123094]|uniref:Uncharacterized protein n=1 Tax=Amniculicola lignicola CBS 123094 TaxID=1392246 RepID=A0A6A5WTV4_9PLEO|nr:hypothetical protein P154DRAFT_356406 [Amniculicola lignicola CBS 123094]